MAGAMKLVGGGRLNTVSDVYLSGDKMARRDERSGQIIDLAAETITNIDFKRNEYSVTTFEQMKQAIERAQAKMDAEMAKAKKKNPEAADMKVSFEVEVKDPGRSDTVGGYEAKEMILIVTTNFEDNQRGATGAMNMSTNMWLSSQVKGYQELTDFYKRMAAKLQWNPSSAMLEGLQQGFQMGESMAKMQEEMAKLDGMAVKQVMRMGGSAQGTRIALAAGSGAGRRRQPGVLDQEGPQGLWAARWGALGGFGRKKKNRQPEPEEQAGAMKASQAGVLMELTTEDTNFSTAAVAGEKLVRASGLQAGRERHGEDAAQELAPVRARRTLQWNRISMTTAATVCVWRAFRTAASTCGARSGSTSAKRFRLRTSSPGSSLYDATLTGANTRVGRRIAGWSVGARSISGLPTRTRCRAGGGGRSRARRFSTARRCAAGRRCAPVLCSRRTPRRPTPSRSRTRFSQPGR